jgi:hypothetical protein
MFAFAEVEKEGLREIFAKQDARREISRRAAEKGMTVQEYLRRQAARRRAADMGLAYWPALLCNWQKRTAEEGLRVDPRAFSVAERVLTDKVGSRWGETLPDGSRSYGGWDSYGAHGLSPWDVARMWLAAGCRNSYKFRAQVAGGVFAKKGDSTNFLTAFIRGYKWVQENGLERLQLSRKAIAALGRISWYCRWAAVHGLRKGEKPLRIRDLNWAAVEVAQKGPRTAIAAGFAPARWGWHQVLGSMGIDLEWEEVRVLRHLNPFEVPQGTLKQLLGVGSTADIVVPAVHVALLFGRDVAAARRFAQANGGLHDAGQFTLPRCGAQWNRKEWAGLASRYPVQIREWLAAADAIERELGRVPFDLAEIREVAFRIPGIIARVGGVNLTSDEKSDYEALWASTPKEFEAIPAPGGSRGIEMGKLRLVQLAYDDPLQPLAGRLVNCCQHLHGAAASCARAAWREGGAAIWAVFENGRMVAQSFVWRSEDGRAIVLDSVEALASREALAEIFRVAAQAVVGKMGVEKVYVGDNGYGVSSMVSNSKDEPAPKCAFHLSYTDASYVRLVCEVKEALPVPGTALRQAMAKAIADTQEEQPAPSPVNELLEGSDVFCEFCDAEVHPDCQICPSCGADISEWVGQEEDVV